MFGFLCNRCAPCACRNNFDEGCGCRKETPCQPQPKVCCEKKCKKVYEVREYCICKDVCRAEYEENFQTHCSGRKILSETEFREFEKRGGGEIKYDYGNDRFDDLQYVGCGKCRAGDTLQYSGCGCKNF